MSKSSASNRAIPLNRGRLSAVDAWSVPSSEPDTSGLDGSWSEDGPRYSFISYKRASDPPTARGQGRDQSGAFPVSAELAHDIWDSQHALLILVDLPGVEPQDVTLSLGSQALYLKVSVPSRVEPRPGVQTGEYEVRVETPDGVGPDAVDASLSNGLLRIRISKAQAGARRVAIVCDDEHR